MALGISLHDVPRLAQSKRDKAERIRHLSQSIRERNQALADSSGGRQACSLRAAPPENGSGAVRERMQELCPHCAEGSRSQQAALPPKAPVGSLKSP